MEELISMVNSVGFPIVCCVVMFNNNAKFTKVLGEISTTLEVMKNEISDLKNQKGGDRNGSDN